MSNPIKKYLLIVLLFLFSGCYQQLHKGPAQWSDVSDDKQAMERGVFAGYYDCVPFEYEDSVFSLKIVFSKTYSVYWHWYDNNDNVWKHTDQKYLIAEIDTAHSFGIDKLNPNSYSHWSNAIKYFKLTVSCCSIDTESNIIDLRPNDSISDCLIVPIAATPKYYQITHKSEQQRLNYGQLIFKKVIK